MFNFKTLILLSSFAFLTSQGYASDLIARGGGGEHGGGKHQGREVNHQNQNHNSNRSNGGEGNAEHSHQNQFSHYSPQFNEGTPNESNVQANQVRRITNQNINAVNRPYYSPYEGGYGIYGDYNEGGTLYVVPQNQTTQYPYENNFIEAD